MSRAALRASRYVRTVAVGLVIGGILGGAAAFGGVASSMPTAQSPNVDGHVYDSYATIYTQQPTTPSAYAQSYDYTNGGSNVTPGFMGVDARKYLNGQICEQTGPQYNSDTTNNMYRVAGSKTCGSGIYSSDGLFYAWTGSSYNTYQTGFTTNQNG